MKTNIIYNKSCLNMEKVEDKSIDLIILDPPYKTGITEQFQTFRQKLKSNGQILWFVQPTELYDLPEKPKQILIWEEPISPKPIYKKYREFLDFIAWYAYGDYTFNKLLWNLMNSRFNDEIIRDRRLHKWEKPESLIEKLIRVHTNIKNIILDPFTGSGTTLVVCKKLNRKYIGYEISKEYCDIAEQRLQAEKTLWDIKSE